MLELVLIICFFQKCLMLSLQTFKILLHPQFPKGSQYVVNRDFHLAFALALLVGFISNFGDELICDFMNMLYKQI